MLDDIKKTLWATADKLRANMDAAEYKHLVLGLIFVKYISDEREFFLDLLFYHTRLHCHVVVELKTVDFEPEFAGKLNFYIKAVDEQLRCEGDQPTIGLLLCKSKDRLVAEYALSDIQKPMGLSTYTLSHTLPEALRDKLPSIEAIERELGLDGG